MKNNTQNNKEPDSTILSHVGIIQCPTKAWNRVPGPQIPGGVRACPVHRRSKQYKILLWVHHEPKSQICPTTIGPRPPAHYPILTSDLQQVAAMLEARPLQQQCACPFDFKFNDFEAFSIILKSVGLISDRSGKISMKK